MTHVYSVKQIKSLIRDLESSSAGDNIAAFGRLVILFSTRGAWASLTAETREDLKQHMLAFLDEPPVAGPDGAFTIRNLPLRLVLKTAEMVPDGDIRDRLDRLRQSDNENLRQAVLAILGSGVMNGRQAGSEEGGEPPGVHAVPPSEIPREENAAPKDYLFMDTAALSRPGDTGLADILAAESEKKEEKSGSTVGVEEEPSPQPKRSQKLFLKAMKEKNDGDIQSVTRVYTRAGLGGYGGAPPASPPAASVEETPEAPPAEAPRRYINTGFVPASDPDKPLKTDVPLKTNSKYYFIFSIGRIASWTGMRTPTFIDPGIPGETEIQVALYSGRDGIVIPGSGDIGTMVVTGNGARVTHQPGEAIPDIPISAHGSDWLFFPVTTPGAEREYEMHCIIYVKQVPIQVLRITAQVNANPDDWPQAMRAWGGDPVFSLSATLLPAVLNQVHEHRASIFFDINTKDTSRLFIFGSVSDTFFKEDISLPSSALQAAITGGRERLTNASIRPGNDGTSEYIYRDSSKNKSEFPDGLWSLVEWGHEIYSRLKLAIPEEKQEAFSRLLQGSSYIQIAMKDGPQNFFPAALLYDFPLQSGLLKYKICGQFMQYLKEGKNLGTITCFDEQCTARMDPTQTTLCPMGFWGFRHILGIPLSVKDESIPSRIAVKDTLNVVIATAGSLDTGDAHFHEMTSRIQTSNPKLYPQVIVNTKPAADPTELLGQLDQSPHIVYFFCHGKKEPGELPVLECGPGAQPFQIPPSYFEGIRSWKETHPLVFINGCHTGDVMPEEYLEFITPLIVEQEAAGVVGTEILIFDSMAARFADACLSSFIGGKTIGESVRDGRLAILSTYNPLGLVYNPFISGGLKLEKI
jgi:hypothetical protein